LQLDESMYVYFVRCQFISESTNVTYRRKYKLKTEQVFESAACV